MLPLRYYPIKNDAAAFMKGHGLEVDSPLGLGEDERWFRV